MQYRVAREVEKIAQPMIGEHHRHLVNTRIVFLFCNETPQSGGAEVWAKTSKVAGINSFLSSADPMPTTWIDKEDDSDDAPKYPEPFFLMIVAWPIWENFDDAQRRALIDHELCHCERDQETEKLSLRGHFIGEFPEVIRRHGLWEKTVQDYHKTSAAAAEQLTIADAEKSEDAA